MKVLKKYGKVLLVSFVFFATLVGSSTAFAHYGVWESREYYNWTGASKVWTHNSDSGRPIAVRVLHSKSSEIGSLVKYVPQDNVLSHVCWGQPLLYRRGRVESFGYHVPGFAANGAI